MSPWTAGLVGLVIGYGIKWVVEAIDSAPEGWQDEHGFHIGKQPLPDEDDTSEWAERENPQ